MKTNILEFPSSIETCLKNVSVAIIKKRCYDIKKDIYLCELSADGTTPFIVDTGEVWPQGNPPDLEDTWFGGQWGNGKYAGCDFDVNLYDKSVYGDDGRPGIAGIIYSNYYLDENETAINMNDYTRCEVTCWFEENGKRTEFKCDDAENFVQRFGEEWPFDK